jgi:hypothetical protein
MPLPTAPTSPSSTPVNIRGSMVTDSITTLNHLFTDTNDGREPNTKKARYLKLTPQQLSQIITACSAPSNTGVLSQPSPQSVLSLHTDASVYVQNAKYEEICCRPIKPPYEGTEEDLMPFLLRLDIRRQDEGWAPATCISINDHQYDLTIQFAHVKEANIVANAECWWSSPTVAQDKHIIGHDTCNCRLLAKCLMASISTDLSITIINHIPDTYRNDGIFI